VNNGAGHGHGLVIGVDVGGAKVLGVALNEDDDLIAEARYPSPTPTRAAFADLVEGGDARPTVDIVMADLGERAGAIGAALFASGVHG
jgi:predicted NBD/HSP70 family sugar kinase